jgi:hypothetical protein
MVLNLSKTLVVGDYKSFGNPLYEGMSSFIEGLVLGNHEVRRFDLLTKRIGPCDNCRGCNTSEFPCAYLDDFNSLAAPLLEADSLVLFAEGDFSKTLENALAKFTAFATHAKKEPHLQKVYLIYLGTELGEKKNFPSWVIALLNIAPDETRAFRYDRIGESEKTLLKSLGQNP